MRTDTLIGCITSATAAVLLMAFAIQRPSEPWEPDHPRQIYNAADSVAAIEIWTPDPSTTYTPPFLIRLRIFLGDYTADVMVPYSPYHWHPDPPLDPAPPDTTGPSSPLGHRGETHGAKRAILKAG